MLGIELFWKTVKPFFSNKGSHRGNIRLIESDKLLQDDSEVVEELNNFFKEAVSTLDINENSYIINPDSVNISDPIEKAISKYKFHPCILRINVKIVNQDKFSFKPKINFRSSHQRCSLKKGSFKLIFSSHQWCSLKKAAPAILLKKKLWHRCFTVNFAKFLRIYFLLTSFGRLLLQIRHRK